MTATKIQIRECIYCGSIITRGNFCSRECRQLSWIDQHNNRDEKPVEAFEPVLRLCENGTKWIVVGERAKNIHSDDAE